MTPERWQQVEGLVEAALEREPTARTCFLDSACDGDADLRHEVAAILESLDQVDDFLETPAVAGLRAAVAELAAPGGSRQETPQHDPSWIGPYRILRELGHGGMGKVYLAERADDEYQRRVAIKLIRPGMDSGSVARRFRGERQILANLDHPNIARLLDGGTTEDGRPYLVMEHVAGTPVDEYCDQHCLKIPQRIELFRKICDAVSYAHRNLVVHRDLKPSNILVTVDGEPKLLDFGIAKLLDPEAFAMTLEVTRTGQEPMTPPYASPEQIRGEVITTASDVYSLGVLLYKLLTGRVPFRLDRLQPQEIEDILSREAPAPSSAVMESLEAPEGSIAYLRGLRPEQLRRSLAGDLDNIVLMALRKEPARRYSSAEQFAEDLRRHLEGMPVRARQPSLRYRAEKFLRRHRLGVAAAAVFLALAMTFAGIIVLQSSQVEKQRDDATAERDKARTVSAALIDLFGVFETSGDTGTSSVTRRLLDEAVSRINLRLNNQPEVQAATKTAVGRVYHQLGLYDEATETIEQALETQVDLFGPNHLEVANTLTELGSLYSAKSEHSKAESHLLEAIRIIEKLAGGDSPKLSINYYHLAINYRDEGRYDKMRSAIETSIALARSPQGTRAFESISSAHMIELAYDYGLVGRHEEAKLLLLRAKEEMESSGFQNSAEMELALDGLAKYYFDTGQHDRAAEIGQKATALAQARLGESHPDVAWTFNSLGLIYYEMGEYEQAESAFDRAIHLREAVSLPRHDLAYILVNAAHVYRRQRRAEKALAAYRRSIALLQESSSPDNLIAAQLLADANLGIGIIHLVEGQDELSKTFLRSSVSAISPLTASSDSLRFLQTHAMALLYLDEIETARPMVERLLDANWKRSEFLELCRQHGFVSDSDPAESP
ncbi:MAG: tetratricopeptide repeat protein [bacterium]|nr:tetratricopeptide repeat protein [bacterium]